MVLRDLLKGFWVPEGVEALPFQAGQKVWPKKKTRLRVTFEFNPHTCEKVPPAPTNGGTRSLVRPLARLRVTPGNPQDRTHVSRVS